MRGDGSALHHAKGHRHDDRLSVNVPASVQPGDGLVLVLAINTLATVGTPTAPAGWQQAGVRTTSSARSVVWRTVAGQNDAGRTVTIGLDRYSKGHLALAAYRGTSSADPISAISSAADTGGQSAHATPLAPVARSGSWVLSWWVHKDSTSTSLTPPPDLTVRATATQTGGGRITSLLADSGGPVPVGDTGGLVATAGSGSTNAHMWTVVLAPAG